MLSYFSVHNAIMLWMKKLDKVLRGHKYICFIDFEGTQFSHEMIAIGAVLCTLDRNGNIKNKRPSFKCFVKAHNKIGRYVSELTGITEEKLKKEGITFAQAMDDLKKYCGIHFGKCLFLTYGNHDYRIISQSSSYSFDFSKDIVSQIQKNFVDYSAFISEFIKDDKGNPLSLVHHCEKFGVEMAGPHHDPSADAENLARLYQAFLDRKDIVGEEYKKVLGKFSKVPDPVRPILERLIEGHTVEPSEIDDQIKKFLA